MGDAYSDLKKTYFDSLKTEPIVYKKLTFTEYVLTIHDVNLPSWYDNYAEAVMNCSETMRSFVPARNGGKEWMTKMIDSYLKYREDLNG